jgi:hypothetical protein
MVRKARDPSSGAVHDKSGLLGGDGLARQQATDDAGCAQAIDIDSMTSSQFDDQRSFVSGQCCSLRRISPNTSQHITAEVRWDQQFSVEAEAMNLWISGEYARRERDARQEVWAT